MYIDNVMLLTLYRKHTTMLKASGIKLIFSLSKVIKAHDIFNV